MKISVEASILPSKSRLLVSVFLPLTYSIQKRMVRKSSILYIHGLGFPNLVWVHLLKMMCYINAICILTSDLLDA